MDAPTYNLPQTGNVTSKAEHEQAINGVLQALLNQLISYADGADALIKGQLEAIATGFQFAGGWDASSGTFPSGATLGTYYFVSTAGTVDGKSFSHGDLLFPLKAGASTTTFVGEWEKIAFAQLLASADGRAMSKAQLIAATDVVVGQSVEVDSLGRVVIVPAAAYAIPATGSAVFDLTGSGLQAALAPGEALPILPDLIADTRPASLFSLDAGAYVPAGGKLFEPVSTGADFTSAGGTGFRIVTGLDASTLSASGLDLTERVISGAGKRLSELEGGGSDLFTMAGNFGGVRDARLQSEGATLVAIDGASYFADFQQVWFGKSAVGIDIPAGNDVFWWSISDSVLRDNDIGIRSAGVQDVNAWTITGSTFFHYDPTLPGVGYALDLNAPNGVVLLGDHIQNQGIKITGGQGNSAFGGYWEAYEKPALDLTDTNWSMFGVNWMAGTRVKVDYPTAEKWAGQSPNISAQGSGGIERVDNLGPALMPYVGPYRNLFADPFCATQAAVDELVFSPSGAKGAVSINGSGNVEIDITASNQSNGVQLVGAEHISFFIKWRATSGQGRLRLYNTTPGYTLDHDSAGDTEWRYSYVYAPANAGSDPAFFFTSADGNPVTIEVAKTILTDTWVAVRERLLSNSAGPVNATSVDADTVTSDEYLGPKGASITIAASATENVYNFSGQGSYLVQVDEVTFLNTTRTYWTGLVTVGTNGEIAVTPFNKNNLTESSSGLALRMTNDSVASRTLKVRTFKWAGVD